MNAQHTIHYELSSSSDLEQLSAELQELAASTVIVAFDDSDRWVATDLQIARLVAAARNSGKQLIAERRAGSIAERAVKLGFTDSAVVSDSPSLNDQETTAIKSHSEDPTAVIPAAETFDSTANLATYRPIERDVTFTWHGRLNNIQSGASSATFTSDPKVTWGPIPGPSDLQGPNVPETGQAGPLPEFPLSPPMYSAPAGPVPLREPVVIGRPPAAPSSAEVPPVTAPPRSRRRGVMTISAAILAAFILLSASAIAAAYMLPEATVTIVPQEETVSSSLTYGVGTTSATFDVSIDPSPVSSTLTARAERETTGERFEAAGTAGGTIQITNPLTSEVTIPSGTEIPGANGVIYYTAEDVRLPAADPFGSMSFGSAAVGVYAGIQGPDGNLSAGALTGQLGNEMFYTNPEAISGGRMDRFPVIAEEDLEAVELLVASELEEIARDEFMDQIPDGLELLPGSIEIGEPEVEVNGSAGDDGETVSASGQVSVRGYVFDPDELHELAGREADRLLARQGGSDRILLAETVAIQGPTDIEGETPGFKIDVEAIARKFIPESEKEALIETLTGLNRSEAEAILADHPKIERYDISIEQSWFEDRMPRIDSRISINVSSGEQTASTR